MPKSALRPGDAPEDRSLVIVRGFAAPRRLVWRAWTDPVHMARWWGPHQFTAPECELDVRPGGAWRIVMRGPHGPGFPIGGNYIEVVENERLVYSVRIDHSGTEWEGVKPPPQTHIILFEDEGAGTKLTIVTRLETAADRDAVRAMGHAEGFGQSLDKLAAMLG
ncbi:MAG: SRPBCC domain-containing protein [Proteobacteria bacterium]|nr:SRPBCC domain-containing protein [Pseudomonadota bacterium]